MDIVERQAGNPAETDDITGDIIRAGTARAAWPSRAMRNENGNTLSVSKQETAAQPHNSGRNAQFQSEPELYKNAGNETPSSKQQPPRSSDTTDGEIDETRQGH